jgi:hypothetical protein
MAEPTLFQNGFIAITTSTGSSTYVELPGVKSISIPFSNAELDDAVMGDVLEAKYPGLQSRPISITARQDFTTTLAATSGLDKRIYNLEENRTAVKVKVRPVDAAVSGPNPSYIWNRVRVFGSSPIDASHGELLVNKIEFRPASGCTVTRSTST